MDRFRPTVTVLYGRGSWPARPNPELPTVTTDEATNIATTTATSGGNVTDDGRSPVTARGVCWSTSSSPTTADSLTSDGIEVGIFTSSLTGLSATTLYYVRAYATNSVGTAYGNEVTFTTAAPPDGNAVYCIPCQSATWTAANKWFGFGPTGIAGFNWQVRIRSPLAFTLTDIRVELTAALTGGAGSTIAWSIQLNDATDDQVVATVAIDDTGAVGSGELEIAENDLIVIEAVRTGTPVASVVTRGITLGYKVVL